MKPLLCAAISVLAARILSRAGLPLPGSPIGFALLLALVSAGCYLLLLAPGGLRPAPRVKSRIGTGKPVISMIPGGLFARSEM